MTNSVVVKPQVIGVRFDYEEHEDSTFKQNWSPARGAGNPSLLPAGAGGRATCMMPAATKRTGTPSHREERFPPVFIAESFPPPGITIAQAFRV